MQRLFAGFPSGPAGNGLILLRLALAFHLLADGIARMSTEAGPDVATSLPGLAFSVLLIGCSGAVLAGFLTPIVQVVVGAMTIGMVTHQVWMAGWALPLEWWQSSICGLVLTIGLALLGPGAYSVDAHLFGRQEIVFEPRPKRPY